MKQKSVLVLYTGGTVGMQKTDRGYALVSGYCTTQLQTLLKRIEADLPKIETREYQPLIDSANMSPREWSKIAQDIANEYDNYDGFIILHGTDTMAYTASALSFMLKNLGKPVILTGSQLPLNHPRTDAMRNIIDSLLYIQNHDIPEVCICFDRILMRGNRSRKLDASHIHAFMSPNYPVLGNSGFELSVHTQHLLKKPQAPFELELIKPAHLLYLPLFPGISSELIERLTSAPLQGLILGAYGTGNGPSEHPELLSVLKHAAARGVLILNTTQCLNGRVDMANYATGRALAECGLIDGSDMTPEAALTKMYYLLSQPLSGQEQARLAAQNLRGELTCD